MATLKGALTRIRYFFKYGIIKDPVKEARKNGVKIGNNTELINTKLVSASRAEKPGKSGQFSSLMVQ